MRKIYVIGVIHNFVSEKETTDILEKYNPDQVFIELRQEHLETKKFKEYGKEFFYVSKWCKKNNKIINGFDYCAKNWLTTKDMTKIDKKNLKNITDKYLAILVKKYEWKKFNQKKYMKLFYESDYYKRAKSIPFIKHIYKILPLRQKMMLKNIRKRMIKKGTVLIITGAGHLDFFEKNIKGAIFPFRK
jgi:hypothetical protein